MLRKWTCRSGPKRVRVVPIDPREGVLVERELRVFERRLIVERRAGVENGAIGDEPLRRRARRDPTRDLGGVGLLHVVDARPVRREIQVDLGERDRVEVVADVIVDEPREAHARVPTERNEREDAPSRRSSSQREPRALRRRTSETCAATRSDDRKEESLFLVADEAMNEHERQGGGRERMSWRTDPGEDREDAMNAMTTGKNTFAGDNQR